MRSVELRLFGGIALLAASAMALATPSAQIEPSAAQRPHGARPAEQGTQIAQAQPYPGGYQYPRPVAQAASPFEQYKAYLAGRARSAGVREATIQAVIPYLRLNQRVMELDRAQRPL